jgi:pre-mRNA-splicing factor SYF1
VELFTYPVSFEIWNIYLSKFVKRYVCICDLLAMTSFVGLSLTSGHAQGGTKLERARDLFEQALEKCPEKSCKPIFLMYAKLEEEHGLAKRAMGIYDRATQVVEDKDKFEVSAPFNVLPLPSSMLCL